MLLQASNTRQACSAALLAFLLDYPLGPKRVEFHFNFLLSNLQVRTSLHSTTHYRVANTSVCC